MLVNYNLEGRHQFLFVLYCFDIFNASKSPLTEFIFKMIVQIKSFLYFKNAACDSFVSSVDEKNNPCNVLHSVI